jgi:hypothetical protein
MNWELYVMYGFTALVVGVVFVVMCLLIYYLVKDSYGDGFDVKSNNHVYELPHDFECECSKCLNQARSRS